MMTRMSAAAERLLRSPERISGAAPESHIIPLDRGDPNFSTPEPIIEAAARALRDGYTHYGDLNGDSELREHIAAEVCASTGEAYTASQVIVTPGSTAGLTSTIMATVDPGDRVILFDPTYAAYAEQIALAGGVPVRVPYRGDGGLDLSGLGAAAAGARLLILCHPASPTGVVFSRSDLYGLASLLQGSDTVVLADEAYADMVYDGRVFMSTLEVPDLRARAVCSRTFSKTYAMAGWRIGYLVAPPNLARAIRLVHRTYNCAVNAAVQKAALFALRAGPSLIAPMLREYQQRRDLVMDWTRRTGLIQAVTPQATFYLFAHYPHQVGSVEMTRRLLEYGVCVRAGVYDGPRGEHHLRISYSVDVPTLTEGLARVEKGLSAL